MKIPLTLARRLRNPGRRLTTKDTKLHDRKATKVILLALDEFREHFFGVDGDEDSLASGQDFILLIENFGHVDVLAAVDAHFPALDVQRFVAAGRA